MKKNNNSNIKELKGSKYYVENRRVYFSGRYLSTLFKGDFYELNGEILYLEDKSKFGWFIFRKVEYDWFAGNIAHVTRKKVYRKENYLEFLKICKDINPWTTILIESKNGIFEEIKNRIIRW